MLERLTPERRAWYAASTRFFSDLGFYPDLAGLRAEELVERIAERVASEWGEPLPVAPSAAAAAPPNADLYLLTPDASRVWYRDLECVYRGANAYAETLREWGAISRGAFAPGDITETWQGDDGPVMVEFTVRGRRHRFVHAGGDYLDMGLRRLVNAVIAGTGYRFEVCDGLGMPNFILVLTPEERLRLERERRWTFYDF